MYARVLTACRFRRPPLSLRRSIHTGLVSAGVGLSAVAFVLALAFFDASLQSTHGKVGAAVVAASLFLPLMGVLRPCLLRRARASATFPEEGGAASEWLPYAWGLVHSWLGRACTGLALAAIFTGALYVDAVGGIFIAAPPDGGGAVPTLNSSVPWIAAAILLLVAAVSATYLALAQAARHAKRAREAYIPGDSRSGLLLHRGDGGGGGGGLTMEEVEASRGGPVSLLVVRRKVYQITDDWLMVRCGGEGRPSCGSFMRE